MRKEFEKMGKELTRDLRDLREKETQAEGVEEDKKNKRTGYRRNARN